MNSKNKSKQIGYFAEGWYTFVHIIYKNRTSALLFILAIFFTLRIANFHFETLYKPLIDPIASIMTLLVAVGLAMMSYHKKWKESLYQTLTVHYKYKGKYVLSCYFSDLTSPADIRNWGQQIGQQMTGAFLDFEAFFDLETSRIVRLPSNRKKVMHHEITFTLKSDTNLRNGNKAFDKNKYERWYIKHSEDHDGDQKLELENISPVEKAVEPDFNHLTLKKNSSTKSHD